MLLNTLTAEAKTDIGAPPLLIAHGLFGSARNWNGLARRLSANRKVVAVDMRNHGDSPHAAANGYGDLAGDLADTIAALGGRADVLGHSMGGKAAMVLALNAPGAVRRLIVADIAPVPYDHTHQPHVEAMRAVDLSGATRRSQADAQLARRIEDRGLRAFLLQSLALDGGPDGARRLRWKLNLDALAAHMDEIIGFPDMTGRRFDGPALFLAGGASDYLRPAHHAAIRALFPRAVFASIPGAGHWLHAEKPDDFLAEATAFLAA